MVSVKNYFIRTKLVADIINKMSDQKTKILCGNKRYSVSDYNKMLNRFMEKHKKSKTLTPSECEAITISSARTGTSEIYKNPYTKTISSDLDTTFYLPSDPKQLLDYIETLIKGIHFKNISLSKDLDCNIYVEDSDATYIKLLKNAKSSDIQRYRDGIYLKLYRHGAITSKETRRLVSNDTNRATTELYRNFERQSNRRQPTKSLLKTEREIYSEYFDRAVKFMNNKNLETLFYFNSVKIEGYIAIPTLMFYLHPKQITNKKLLQIVIAENLADSLIHLENANHMKKAKYLLRLNSAMKAATMSCSKDQKTKVDTLTQFAMVFERMRKTTTDLTDFDSSYRNLALMILNQIDSSIGIPYDIEKISKGNGSITKKELERATLNVLKSGSDVSCHR
ncbi:hypothetical protein EXVG_00258 [Emiliania huxleyi virus 202]|nr:hypothetical protein EXVG_00258 [Emiliania huxleyi virus 202]AHA54123.1 hypothetical protein EhV18_00074 [Emiliania huxleyi virus 18]AHA55170.1 hypothetical protein EhV156_00071 [Emiliania huxleyi virus 156]